MAKINDEIVGGLVSALSRGEKLEKAMMTFFNAGYEKDEIEVSAQEVYKQLGPQAMGTKSALQETIDSAAVKAGVEQPKDSSEEKKPETPEQIAMRKQIALQKPSPSNDKKPVLPPIQSRQNQPSQIVSQYGPPTKSNGSDKNEEDITNKIEAAIKKLRPVNIPSRIEIVHKNSEFSAKSPQKVSAYYSDTPKSVNKSVTYVLLAILLLLLGALIGVFLFKDDLIKMFNNIGLG